MRGFGMSDDVAVIGAGSARVEAPAVTGVVERLTAEAGYLPQISLEYEADTKLLWINLHTQVGRICAAGLWNVPVRPSGLPRATLLAPKSPPRESRPRMPGRHDHPCTARPLIASPRPAAHRASHMVTYERIIDTRVATTTELNAKATMTFLRTSVQPARVIALPGRAAVIVEESTANVR